MIKGRKASAPVNLDEYPVNIPVPKKEAIEPGYVEGIRRIEEGTIPAVKIER